MLSKMIEERISMMNDGVLFIINDFIDIASYDTIKKNLQRLMKRNVIFKVIDGIYMKPKYSDIIGSLVPCSVYDLADCIARKQGWDIIPTGEVAINYFGLSTQLQATYVYSSSGPYRDIVYGKSTISFRHTASKKLANMSKKVQYLVQAINYYGKKNFDDKTISILKGTVDDDLVDKALAEAKIVDTWIYDVIKKIKEAKTND